MLWDAYCLVRISLVCRGRAIPIVWTVLEHPSSSVAYEVYKSLLDKGANGCLCRVLKFGDKVNRGLRAQTWPEFPGAYRCREAHP